MSNHDNGTEGPLMAVQQIQLARLLRSESDATNALRAVREAGLDAIELNGFMIRATPAIVRLLTRAAGMPTGNAGKLDWPSLISQSGLRVVAIHEDLGTIETDPDQVAASVHSFGTQSVVCPGVYRFDFSNHKEVENLAARLNASGEALSALGVSLYYHNHNAEFRRTDEGMTAFETLIKLTDPALVGFEVDLYWADVAGVDVCNLMKSLGNRARLCHVTDRGTRRTGKTISPIDKIDSVELGLGNMPYRRLLAQARENGMEAVIIETHRNWINNSPLESMRISAEYLRKNL